ncbi:Uncharacterised protein [Mycobacteroides abscessus subsp. abscessus]|nr:Uncharacterised protein [Mycobacteroides abscessus subsp. abscessus]
MCPQGFLGGYHNGEEVCTFAVAVDEDLAYQRRTHIDRFQIGDRDELALGELDDVIAPVHVHQLVRRDLRHDIARAVVAVGVEHLGGDVGTLVVAGRCGGTLDQQFATRMGLVGGVVPELRNIDELVVEHRRPGNLAVSEHAADLGQAVQIKQMKVQ